MHGNVERTPGRRHAHEAAAIGSRDSGDEHDAIAVDERLVGRQRDVGKGMEQRLIDPRDCLPPTRQPAGQRAFHHTILGVELGQRIGVAPDKGLQESSDQRSDLVSGHDRA